MGRLEEIRIDLPLTKIARGYSNGQFIGEALFPTVPVDKESGKIALFGKEAFKLFNTLRAPRAKSNVRDTTSFEWKKYAIDEYDLVGKLDRREVNESGYGDAMTIEVETNQKNMLLIDEKKAADIAQDDSLYATANVEEIVDGNDSWNDDDSDPEDQMNDYRSTLRSKIGIQPNVCVMGISVFEALERHPKLREQLKYRTGGIVTIEELQRIFKIPKIVVGEGLYCEEGSSNFTNIWGDNVILAYVAPQQSGAAAPTLPSFGYRLQLKGFPVVEKYTEEEGKVHCVRNTQFTSVELVGVKNTGTKTSPVYEIESAFLVKNVCA